MEKPVESLPDIYPLTGLQIGDIQSYVSQAFLYFAPLSKKLLILVDNRPWLMNKHSRSARLWQLMVTKYRMSPFMNSRTFNRISDAESNSMMNGRDQSIDDHSAKSRRWLRVIDSRKWQKRYLLSAMDLSKALHGFLVFEVAWKDVHGINYLNELQADTSLAIEVRYMKKWEFYSPEQASTCISLWFLGRLSETQTLKSYLKKLSGLDLHLLDAQSFSKEISNHKSSPLEAVSEEEFLDVQESPTGEYDELNSIQPRKNENTVNKNVNEFDRDFLGSTRYFEEKKSSMKNEMEETFVSSTQYSDMLILLKFSDSLLPFKLRQVIMSDIRLLTLLESGLPSWVIFFQSYPLFCHFYRPWMRPLAKTFYILISLATVIIGFYDLYKNVPLLKATAARLCGPFFGWIEGWDMVTRIQYLGTILFLRNIKKSVKLFLLAFRAVKTIFVSIAEPLAAPFSEIMEFISPLWSLCAKMAELLSSTAGSLMDSVYTLFVDFTEVLLSPFELLYSYFWTTATSCYPLLKSLWELCLIPVRCVHTLANYMGSLLSNSYNLLKDIWETICSIFELTHMSETEQSTFDISVLQELWNDLFSQVFRAVRSILNGLLAFFTSCNRHRLSIYNHIQAMVQRLFRVGRAAPHMCHCQKKLQSEHQNDHQEEYMECDCCK
uniref:G1/S-specific cyclin-E protein n=1 Tax=Ananas comosus var. bracteatus TaxID=296719 RepID=A0A6V7QY00_ANACO